LDAPEDWRLLTNRRKIELYFLAFASSSSGVLSWKGIYNILSYRTFDASLQRELGYFCTGLIAILLTNTLTFNAGTTNFDPITLAVDELQDPSLLSRVERNAILNQKGIGAREENTGSPTNTEEAEESISHALLTEVNPQMAQNQALFDATIQRTNTPFSFFGLVYLYLRVITAFIAGFFFWTGFWNILSDYISHYSLERDLFYIMIGFFLLAVTNTLVGNAGITPIAIASVVKPRNADLPRANSRLA